MEISGLQYGLPFPKTRLLYLLDQSLDDLHRRRIAPPLQLLPLLQRLCQLPGLSHPSHQAVLLALLTKDHCSPHRRNWTLLHLPRARQALGAASLDLKGNSLALYDDW